MGGDQVWAYQPDKESEPPASGWRVPYDGPVDNTFILYPAPGGAPTPTPAPAPAVIPVPTAPSYDGYASAPQGYSWGQPAYSMPPMHAGHAAPPTSPWASSESQKREQEQRQRELREREMREREKQERERQQMEERRRNEAARREAQAKAQAEERRRKEAEMKAQQEKAQQELEKRKQEQRSVLAIRRQIQKVRSAPPETLDAMEKELKDLLQCRA